MHARRPPMSCIGGGRFALDGQYTSHDRVRRIARSEGPPRLGNREIARAPASISTAVDGRVPSVCAPGHRRLPTPVGWPSPTRPNRRDSGSRRVRVAFAGALGTADRPFEAERIGDPSCSTIRSSAHRGDKRLCPKTLSKPSCNSTRRRPRSRALGFRGFRSAALVPSHRFSTGVASAVQDAPSCQRECWSSPANPSKKLSADSANRVSGDCFPTLGRGKSSSPFGTPNRASSATTGIGQKRVVDVGPATGVPAIGGN